MPSIPNDGTSRLAVSDVPRRSSDSVSLSRRRLSGLFVSNFGKSARRDDSFNDEPRHRSSFSENFVGSVKEQNEKDVDTDNASSGYFDKESMDDGMPPSNYDMYSASQCVDINNEIEQCSMNKKEGALLLFVFVAYLLLGGVVFMALESQHEQNMRRDVTKKMEEVDHKLFQADRHNFTRESLRSVINELASARSLGLIDAHGNHTHAKWDFANSVFFAITVVTTIGYGHLYPATGFGRTFCVLYGMFGIPLTGILLASIGDHFSIQLMRALNKAKRIHTSKFAITINTLSVFIPWLLVFVFLPAGLFMVLEKWPYDVALYYSFVTLATIGFGDFVAASNNVDYIWLYKIMLIAWIIFGLGYLSTILNFISKAMQSKKLKNMENRISEKFNRFKVVIDNATSRVSSVRRSSTSRTRSMKTRGSVDSANVKKHRRSKSLDLDATSDNENIVDSSEEVLTEKSSIPENSAKKWYSKKLERNNNQNKNKDSKTSNVVGNDNPVNLSSEEVVKGENKNTPEIKDSRVVDSLLNKMENGKVSDL